MKISLLHIEEKISPLLLLLLNFFNYWFLYALVFVFFMKILDIRFLYEIRIEYWAF